MGLIFEIFENYFWKNLFLVKLETCNFTKKWTWWQEFSKYLKRPLKELNSEDDKGEDAAWPI